MKEFKGTPGPWVLLQAGDRTTNKVPVDRGNTSILTIVEEDGVKFAAVYEDEDAHLIAAAPELLEDLMEAKALVEFLADHLVGRMGDGALVDMAIKADNWNDTIAKALGETE